MAITTGNFPKALWPGVHRFVMGKYDEWANEYPEIFEMHSSDKKYEEQVEISSFGYVPEKGEGSAVSYDSHQQGFTKRYTHVARGMGYIVTREEMDDNLYNQAFDRAGMLVFSFKTTKETVAANILNRAFNSSYTGGDGVELLSSAHPSLAGNWSNELNDGAGTAVPADLSEAALEDMLILIEETNNSRGLPIKIMGDKLIVAPANGFNAERIVKSTLQNDTANNAVNAMKSRGMLPGGVCVNHYLTDSDAWFVKTNCPNGLQGFDRAKFEFTRDNDFDTMNMKAKGYERYVFGWTDPRGLFGSEGA